MYPRKARAQSQVVNPTTPLSLQMDPSSPTLEQLWEGQVDLSLKGPAGLSVEICVSFYEVDGESPIFAQRLPLIPLPAQSVDWNTHFSEHVQKRKDAQDAYDTAHASVCLHSMLEN